MDFIPYPRLGWILLYFKFFQTYFNVLKSYMLFVNVLLSILKCEWWSDVIEDDFVKGFVPMFFIIEMFHRSSKWP